MNNLSPSKNIASLLGDGDSFSNKYLNEGQNRPAYGHEIMKEHLQSQIQSINSALVRLPGDRLQLGDLFSSNLKEVQKSIEVIKVFLTLRQRDMETRNELYTNLRKLQSEKGQLGMQLQKYQKDGKRLQNQRESLSLKVKGLQKSMKQSSDRWSQQRQQLNKRLKAIQARENQYKNESRKLQNTIKTLQDKINKGQDKVPFKNSFEVMQHFHTYGPTIIMMNGQNQYNQMVVRTMEENYQEICRENQYYRDCLQGIYKELQSVLDLKRQVLRRRRGYDSEYDSSFQLRGFKGELLNLPQQYSRQGLNLLNQNILKFRQAMKLGQYLDDKQADQKISCVSNVKSLIRNYKGVVESQQQLINRVIVKAKEFRNQQMQSLEGRYGRGIEEDELDRARKFLQEQSGYLESKNKELEMTRKAMQSTIRKAEQERQEFARRSNQVSEQVLRIRKQVQLLPSLVDQELSSL